MRELGTFLVNYPCWVLIHKKSMVLDEQGRMTPPLSFMMLDDQQGGTTFPAFSDGDLASRFLHTCDDANDFTIVAATSSKMLAEALKASRGITDAMSFDQPAMRTKPYGIWPLEYAIERIEAGELL